MRGMTDPRPRTRWKRLVVVSLLLFVGGTYGILAWGAGAADWPVQALRSLGKRAHASSSLFESVPFTSSAGGGFVGLPGTNIWAKVPPNVFGTRCTPTYSQGILGLRPAISWRESGQARNVFVTTCDAVAAGPSIAFIPDHPGFAFWTDLRETLTDIIADAESSGAPDSAYSIALDAPAGAHKRMDVDLEHGAVVIVQWHEGDPEPPDMWEFFTIGEPVPADGR